MTTLKTIQKRNKLNQVDAVGDKGPGGAHHTYEVTFLRRPKDFKITIQFQKGPRNSGDSIDGVIDEDLLEMVRHRLRDFQQGAFACKENAQAITHIESALMWLNKRKEDRSERKVLSTYKK